MLALLRLGMIFGYALSTGSLLVRADTFYKCFTDVPYPPDYDSWGDCQKAWNMLILQQTGCDGIAYLPSTYVSTQYGSCIAQMRSKIGGSAIDSTLVGSSFNMLSAQCAGLGQWVYSDGSGIAQVFNTGRSTKRSESTFGIGFINGTEPTVLDLNVATSPVISHRGVCSNGKTLFSNLKCLMHLAKMTVEKKLNLTPNKARRAAMAAAVVEDMRNNAGNTIHLAQTIHGEGGDATFAIMLDAGNWGNLLAVASEDQIRNAIQEAFLVAESQGGATTMAGNLEAIGGSFARFNLAANDNTFALAA
ncbi:hypothetical protein GGI35DRAFT_485187 [Trichoderma velutinum]